MKLIWESCLMIKKEGDTVLDLLYRQNLVVWADGINVLEFGLSQKKIQENHTGLKGKYFPLLMP